MERRGRCRDKLREPAVRMVIDHRDEYDRQWRAHAGALRSMPFERRSPQLAGKTDAQAVTRNAFHPFETMRPRRAPA